jgi:group II intron reverse transcriptase/maturase
MLDSKITTPQRLLAAKAWHDKTHRFGNIYYFICREDWIQEALNQVLDNKGSGTAGIDGQTLADLGKQENRTQLVQTIRAELRNKTYTPMPVRRAYIPKSNGKRRPLGIPTIKDRVVQCLLKMLLEPVYESDFLDCSSGFRPMRRTMDCIAACYSNINRRHLYYWVIEGDIEGCFDHIHHKTLLRILEQRIADKHILDLIDRFLQAGIMEGALFKHTPEGVPQGGIFSPLLANTYLHQLDKWWYENYHLTHKKRYERRRMGLGNYILIRYADDFIVLCNGRRQSAEEMKGQLQEFLSKELHLKLSVEKTRITHVQDGFEFLGFHLQHRKWQGRERLIVQPSTRNIQRFKKKIKCMTAGNITIDNEYNKLLAINSVLRGWSEYYKHVSSSRTFSSLDFWVESRVLHWLSKKHKLGIMDAAIQFIKQQTLTRKNIGIQSEENRTLWLYLMGTKHIGNYLKRSFDNPFMATDVFPVREEPSPSTNAYWNGGSTNSEWRDVRFAALARDHYRCTNPSCGNTQNLDVHHVISRAQRPDLALNLDNLTTLCGTCHIEAHRTDARNQKAIGGALHVVQSKMRNRKF